MVKNAQILYTRGNNTTQIIKKTVSSQIERNIKLELSIRLLNITVQAVTVPLGNA